MEQQVDEKIIHIKCTKDEKEKIVSELSKYLYDYQFNFIEEETKSENNNK